MKGLKIFFTCILCVVVALVPFSAFAATTEYNSGIRWNDIIADNNIDLQSDYVIWRDTSGYYYIGTYDMWMHGAQATTNAGTISSANNINLIYYSTGSYWTVYKSGQAYNPYGTYNMVATGENVGYQSTLSAVCANSIPITYEGSSVFRQVPLTTSTGTSLPSGPTSSSIYSGVLIEVISILPILVPVLITFLAIRKGLRFIFKTLRAS